MVCLERWVWENEVHRVLKELLNILRLRKILLPSKGLWDKMASLNIDREFPSEALL